MLFSKLNEDVTVGGIVFAGDSITEGYPIYEMYNRMLTIYNRGIGGIKLGQQLTYIDAHISDLQPKQLFLQMGTNNIGQSKSNEEIVTNISTFAFRK